MTTFEQIANEFFNKNMNVESASRTLFVIPASLTIFQLLTLQCHFLFQKKRKKKKEERHPEKSPSIASHTSSHPIHASRLSSIKGVKLTFLSCDAQHPGWTHYWTMMSVSCWNSRNVSCWNHWRCCYWNFLKTTWTDCLMPTCVPCYTSSLLPE